MLTFLYPILDAICEGPFVRVVLKYCLRVFAGVIGLVGLMALIAILKLSFNQAVPTSVTMAGLIMACLFVAATFCQVQICLYRATKIELLPATRYAVIPAACHLIRLAGELLATSICTLGVAAFVAAVVAGEAGGMLESVIPGPFGRVSGSGFGGFVALLAALAISFSALVVFYLSAEGLQLVVDVAEDVRYVASVAPAPAFAPGLGTSSYGTPAPSRPTSGARICPTCQALVPTSDAFCNMCGARVDQLTAAMKGGL